MISIIIKVEEDIMIVNNVTKFHKVVIQINGLIDQSTSNTVNFHEQRAITLEGMVQCEPISNLKKVLLY